MPKRAKIALWLVMPATEQIESLVQRVVREVLDVRLPELRDEICRRLAEQLGSAPLSSSAAGLPEMAAAVESLHGAVSQADVLNNLLGGAARFAGRVALFIVRSGAAIGWQGRGLEERAVKATHLGLDQGSVAKVMASHRAVVGPPREFDDGFVNAVGAPAEDTSLLVPLSVRDKIAAVLYADAGNNGGPLNRAALELLVRSAGVWLEVEAARKAGTAPGAERAVESVASAPVTEAATPAAGIALAAANAAAMATSAPPVPSVNGSVSAAPPISPDVPPQDAEIHKKARRFAKLLVEEIKLYNQDKVAAGRQQKDLYDRLKEDIDKSSAAYDKRYGATPAAAADYFNAELLRLLADNDASLFGSNFPG